MNIDVDDGLTLEVTGRELSDGLPVTGQHGRRYLLGVPAALLIALLVVPMVWTLGWALDADVPVVGNFRDLFTDPAALRSAWHSVLWVGIAVVLIVVGYGVAVLSRHVGRKLWRVLLYALILPFGVSAVVSGAVFRLIFDPNPERGMATALFGGNVTWLGPDLIWWVLASAFAWSWLGFVVVLFRAGLESAGGATFRLGRWTLARPGPVTPIVVLTVLVAAIRVFDLVLIATPGSIADDVDVVGLHWWRMVLGSADTGGPAALAVLLFAVVAVLSATGMRTTRAPAGHAPPATDDRRAPRWWSWPLVGLIGLLWIMPVLVLVLTALHSPESAGAVGWWHFDPVSLSSFAAVGSTWLWPAVAGSFLIAGLATGLVLVAAVPLAYLLTWVAPRRLAGLLTGLLAILAVAPVQMYAGPLGAAFDALGLTGARAPLALVHAAAGLPFATLVLRTAFLAAPARDGRPALDSMWRRGPYGTTLVAAGVLEFILVWNDFIVGFLINGSASSPLTLLLWGEARQFGSSAGTVAAAAVVSAVVPITLLLVTWKRVVAGLTGKVAP
jgi:alpha-glucoside transport system permease protein